MLWQGFWLELCTKQVVSARACANQFLPCSSSGIALFGMKTVQADSCLNSEQIATFLLMWGVRKGCWGGGGILGRRFKKCTWMSWIVFSPTYLFSPHGLACTDTLVVMAMQTLNIIIALACRHSWSVFWGAFGVVVGLARTVHIHRIWPYIWWCSCQ